MPSGCHPEVEGRISALWLHMRQIQTETARWHLSPAQIWFCPDYTSKSDPTEITRTLIHAILQPRVRTRRWQGLVHPWPPGPFVLCLSGCLPACLSLPPSLVIHMHAHWSACVPANKHASWYRCIILPAVARCLSSHESSVEIRPTECSVQSYLQVKCARLTHAAAVMTTLKCFLFLERPRNATALAAFFRPTVSTLERVSALASVQILPSPSRCSASARSPPPRVHLRSAKGTCCRWARRAVLQRRRHTNSHTPSRSWVM